MIQDAQRLSALVEHLRQAGRFALDTEFVREKTYRPRLCLLQVATVDTVEIVDPLAVDDLGEFLELIFDPGVEKIVHAGEQDMEIFFSARRQAPRGVVDTQIAAALTGHGESVSYARLVEDLCGVRLPKGQTYTDWARRPLSPQQVEYALEDVRYLPAMLDALRGELASLGRLDWFADELRFFEETSTYARDPLGAFRKVRGWGKLAPRQLAVLRELAAWREREAEKKDKPRGRIVSDDILLEVSRRSPRTLEALRALRGVYARIVDRFGKGILAGVERGRAVPDAECPRVSQRPRESPELSAVVAVLDAVLRSRATELRIAPGYLASRRDLLQIASRELNSQGKPLDGASTAEPPALLSGWRRDVVGELLLEVLRGRRHVVINPATCSVDVACSGRPRGDPKPQSPKFMERT